jgi:hypothetical protein
MLACGLVAGLLVVVSAVIAQTAQTAQTPATPATPAAPKHPVAAKAFSTPQEAANALVNALEKYNLPELEKIVGPEGHDLVTTGEPARDKEMAEAFAKEARTKMNVEIDPKKPNRATLVVGDEDWPLPVPIVKLPSGKWSFDSAAGRRELLYRRIGRNELDAIQICHGYVEAQHEYALQSRANGFPVNQFAQKIISTPGKKDGLAWQNADGTWGGPVGPNIAKAITQGYSTKQEPYHGYYFKVLKGQGPAAPLGQMDFLVHGAMIGGFALIAAPAHYRVTGVKTFMVSHDGVVYERDLGPNTLEIAKKIELFNPDKTWTPVAEQ